MTYKGFCLVIAACFVISCWGKEKEFKLKSQEQPHELFALNHMHFKAINMKSHSSVAR